MSARVTLIGGHLAIEKERSSDRLFFTVDHEHPVWLNHDEIEQWVEVLSRALVKDEPTPAPEPEPLWQVVLDGQVTDGGPYNEATARRVATTAFGRVCAVEDSGTAWLIDGTGVFPWRVQIVQVA